MSFGSLNRKQAAVLHKLVRGRPVYDLGAGDLDMAVTLATTLGAKSVYVIDKYDPIPSFHHAYPGRALPGNVRAERRDVLDLARESWMGGAKIAMLSWPPPGEIPGLVDVLRAFPYVAYLGQNVWGVDRYGQSASSWCGPEAMWRYLVTRNVAAYVPDPVNTLIVYGPRTVDRAPFGEELAALTNRTRRSTWKFEDVERAAREAR